MTKLNLENEGFALRDKELVSLIDEKPESGRWFAIQARGVQMPNGPRMAVRQRDHAPIEQAAIIACEMNSGQAWQWLQLSAVTKEALGDMMFDNKCELDRWYFVTLKDLSLHQVSESPNERTTDGERTGGNYLSSQRGAWTTFRNRVCRGSQAMPETTKNSEPQICPELWTILNSDNDYVSLADAGWALVFKSKKAAETEIEKLGSDYGALRPFRLDTLPREGERVVYLARDKTPHREWLWMFSSEPKLIAGVGLWDAPGVKLNFDGNGTVEGIDEMLVGQIIDPGQCVRIRLSVEDVEEKNDA